MKKVLESICIYGKDRRNIDLELATIVLEEFKRKHQLNNEVQECQISNETIEDESTITLGRYHKTNKKIVIYNKAIKRNAIGKIKTFAALYSPKQIEIEIFYNMELLHTMLHELTHGKQEKLKKQSSIEGNIVAAINSKLSVTDIKKLLKHNVSNDTILKTIDYIEKKDAMNYRKNYSFAPIERLAEIEAYEEQIGILQHASYHFSNLIQYYKDQIDELLLYGYKVEEQKITSPTMYYYKNNGYEKHLSRYPWYSDNESQLFENIKSIMPDCYDRKKYGLPIDKFEYNQQELEVGLKRIKCPLL